jgi:hypothetical protein
MMKDRKRPNDLRIVGVRRAEPDLRKLAQVLLALLAKQDEAPADKPAQEPGP